MRAMSIFQSPVRHRTFLWPSGCSSVMHQPFSLMLSTSELHVRILPELSLTSMAASDRALRVSSRGPRVMLYLVAGLSLLGIAFAFLLRTVPAGNPDPH